MHRSAIVSLVATLLGWLVLALPTPVHAADDAHKGGREANLVLPDLSSVEVLGMTGHSLVPMAAKAVGISYADLCVAILSEASCKVHSPARNA